MIPRKGTKVRKVYDLVQRGAPGNIGITIAELRKALRMSVRETQNHISYLLATKRVFFTCKPVPTKDHRAREAYRWVNVYHVS